MTFRWAITHERPEEEGQALEESTKGSFCPKKLRKLLTPLALNDHEIAYKFLPFTKRLG